MLTQKLNRTDPEKVYISVLNMEGATITTGNAVAYQNVNSMNGIGVVIANSAADYAGFLGVAKEDIANNDYGLVQVAGFCNSILISAVGSSLTVNAGDPMVPGPKGFFSAAPTYANSGFKFVALSNAPVAVSAASYASGLIKGL